MKKITLWAALLFVSIAFAQEISIVDRPSDDNIGVIAVEGNDGSGIYIADSFTISEGFGLNSITVYGFHSNQSETVYLRNFNLIIYEDNEGNPGNGIYPQISGEGVIELKGISSENYNVVGTSSNTSVTIDIVGANGGEAPTLVAGTYWMVCYPTVESSPVGDGRWNWYLSSALAPIEPVIIDPQNIFGMGITDWSSVSNVLGVPSASFAWSMQGSPALGIKANEMAQISLYPNPAKDIVRLKMPSDKEVTGVSLYNVLGKQMEINLVGNQINVAHLSKGLYILSLETNVGKWTEKLIVE